MYVIPDLRLNAFQDVRIPSAKDLYSKFGLRSVASPGSVGSDGNFSEPVNTEQIMSKLDGLRVGEIETYRQYAASQSKSSEHSEPSPSSEPSESSQA